MSKQNWPELHTFGCRLNIWESEVMRRHAETAGLNDVVIVNTCAVTKEAAKGKPVRLSANYAGKNQRPELWSPDVLRK